MVTRVPQASDSCEPDYRGLVLRVLPSLKNFGYVCAACPELTISEEEAKKIRALGFRAQDGRWRVPYIPFFIVRDGPLEWTAWIEQQTVTGDGQGQACEAAVPPPTELQPLQVTGGNPERATAGRQFATTPRAPKRTPGRYHLMPAQQYGPVEPVVKECAQKIEQALQKGPFDRRLLQQRMGRYGYKAPIFHQALRYLSERGKITLNDD
jgi:hypothetical protein